MQDPNSEYYRKELPDFVKKTLDTSIKRNTKIVVGDAPGIDRQVQDYLKKNKYKNVDVYSPGTQARYLASKYFGSKLVDASEFEKGSKEWLAKKDIEMTNIATKGLAIILDEGSSATRKNIERLADQGKKCLIYQLNKNGKDTRVKGL